MAGALIRLSGKKKKVNTDLPVPGDNLAPRQTPEIETPEVTKKAEMPSLARGPAPSTASANPLGLSGKVPDRGATVLGMPVDKFSQLAGGLGQALAPNTPMGRVGGFVSNLATKNLDQKRVDDLRKENRALQIEDRIAGWKHSSEVTKDNREYNESVDQKKWNRGAPSRELTRKVNEARLENLADGDKTASITEYNLAKDQGYKGSFVDWKKEFVSGRATKPADLKANVQKTLKNYEGATDEATGEKMPPLENMKQLAFSGDPVARVDYLDTLKGYGYLPDGEIKMQTNRKTGENVFYSVKEDTYYDVNGKKLNISRKTPEPPMSKGH